MIQFIDRKQFRHPDFDYNRSCLYHVIINTKNRIKYFGEIIESQICLSEFGEIVERCWLQIPDRFTNVSLDAFTIMPDHFHGIVCIDDIVGAALRPVDVMRPIQHDRSKMGLSLIIQSFKSRTSKRIRKIDPEFAWHRSYYDVIIRNYQMYQNVHDYIRANPRNWLED